MLPFMDAAQRPREPEETPRHRVVILGGGFGGLRAARNLRRAPVDVTVVDRRNFHLFQPLLYQVATSGLSPGDISSPIRRALRKQRNTRVLLGEAVGLDASRREVMLRDGERLPYDTLVVATGSRHHYFGNADWERQAPGLKTLEDATEIRRRVLLAFERAEREPDAGIRSALLAFVIVGAGPTGVELAGAICELARDTLRDDFRRIDPREARILLVEADDRVLPAYPDDLSAKAQRSLERLGTEVRVGTRVEELDDEGVTLESDGRRERVATRCVLWAAGVRASSLSRVLEKEAGASLDRAGRVRVEPDCSLPGRPEIFAIGDIASFCHGDGEPLPGSPPSPCSRATMWPASFSGASPAATARPSATATVAAWPPSGGAPRWRTSDGSGSAGSRPGCSGRWSTSSS